MIDKFWLELHRTRHGWAYDAYSRFVEGIDAELKADYTRSDQVTVVVYGSTQVGKTTLILDMLGIAPEHAALVNRVLRGGRTAGHSSTATALRYRRSNDDRWRFGTDTTPRSDAEVEQQFRSLRSEVEAGTAVLPDVLDVHIPREYFAQQADALSLDIRLIDLPGLNAANQNEVEHVHRLAQKHVPVADLIVLVGRADDLGFVNPKALRLPELQDWALYPRRFRIVCTYSFHSASVREWFAQAPRSAANVKARLMEQLRTHDYPLSDEVGQYVYPLDFGDSWNDLKRARADYFEQAQSVVDTLRADFMASVRRSANPYSRVRMAFDLQRLVAGKIQKAEALHDADLAAREPPIDAANEERSVYVDETQHIDDQIAQAVERDAALAALSSGSQLDALLEAAFPVQAIQPDKPSEQKASLLMSEARSCVSALQKLWTHFPDPRYVEPSTVDAALLDDLPVLGASPPATALSDYIDKLDDYWVDWYTWGLSGFESDLKQLREIMLELRSAFVRRARQLILAHWDAERQALRRQIANRHSKREMLLHRIAELGKSIDTQVAEREAAQCAYDEFKSRMARSVEHARRFREHMESAHGETLQAVARRVQDETHRVRRFYLLAFHKLLEPEFEKMMNGESQ